MQSLALREPRALIAPSERNAIRVLLIGGYFGRRITRSLVGIAAVIFCWFCLPQLRGNRVLDSGAGRFLAVLTAYVGGIAAASVIYPMIGRARYLWLKARLDRGQLFRAVEAESWRTLLSVSAFALGVCTYLCFLERLPWTIVSQILLPSFASGAAMLYVVLLSTREWPVVDALLVTALSALWFFGLLLSLSVSAGSRLLLLAAPPSSNASCSATSTPRSSSETRSDTFRLTSSARICAKAAPEEGVCPRSESNLPQKCLKLRQFT